ncbi:Na+/H+ antiporter NhaC family protein [Paraferrimonas sp. SM1919]|uniref:Na+/H+ antiporter NhaC family protein n=1 Tax=Paraferrimonas sp. SM1919 TaxID=2662263 RepID=UPI0013D72E42|nr:Na+/H+ antiporter NhaC family protein [Paraferrimonas sp. SM1919]
MVQDNYINYADSALSILPPVIAIGLAIITRKVLLSLGLGILTGIALLTDFSVAAIADETISRAIALVWQDGSWSSWNLYTIGFLLSMGALMAIISVSGGTAAFGNWARSKVRSGKDSQLMTLALGVIIFIDDYFNTLLVGNVARPVTDRYQISREKLAYCIDSTSAPVCVISPISTWGAYIMSLLASILVLHGIDSSTLAVFVQMIPLNFYAVFALAILLCVVLFDINIGPMAKAEMRAKKAELWDHAKGNPAGEDIGLPESEKGTVANLVVPLVMLILLVVFFMLQSGAAVLSQNGQSFSLIGALENAAGSQSMCFAGMITIAVNIIWLKVKGEPTSYLTQGIISGIKSMLPAVYILVLAWTIAGVISDLQTGKFLASLAQGNLSAAMIPMLVFLLSALTALATGTSYGTFAIMLPIAANLAGAMEPSLMMASMAAVLAGGVFGDHCSPISDTTILSSTGSACHHIDHVATQLPYALLAAIASIAGYLVLGFTGSLLFALATGSALLAVIFIVLNKRKYS